MNFWIDIDDTISDTESVLMDAACAFHQTVLGRALPGQAPAKNASPDYFGFARYLGWDAGDTGRFFHANYPDMLRFLAAKPGVDAFFRRARARGHRITLLSARRDREYGGRTMDITRAWLGSHGLAVDGIVLDCTDKAKYLRGRSGCFIDDGYENCMAVCAEPGIQTVQFLSEYGKRCTDSRVLLMSQWSDETYRLLESALAGRRTAE